MIASNFLQTHTASQAVKKMAMFPGPASQHLHTERAWERG